MTRIPDRVRKLVMERDRYSCVVCGQTVINRPGSIQHRRPRGSGGSRKADTNSPQNLIVLCGTGTTGCHGWAESNRTEAFDAGWLVHAWENPAEVPVALSGIGVVYLHPDGSTAHVPHVDGEGAA